MLPFLRLEDLVASPPLPALLSIALVLGLARLGFSLGRRLRGSDFELADGLLATVCVAAVLGAAIHGLALSGALRLWPLRLGSWTIALIGLLAVAPFVGWLRREVPTWWARVRETSRAEQVLAAFLVVIAVGFLLGVLGPATDEDSVDYHLGVMLDWLRHGGAYARSDWFDSRLVGLGDTLDLLGLAGGTDGLGASLQALGVVVAVAATTAFCRTEGERLLACALVLTSPVLSELVPTQKPQFLPAAAGILALTLVVRRRERLDRATLVLAMGALAFALACKLSFLLSVPFLVFLVLLSARRAGQLPFALSSAALAFALLAAPVYLRNWWFYGDPLSPLLERWRANPDPALVNFAAYLHEWGGPPTVLGVGVLFLRALGCWRNPALMPPLGLGVLTPFVSWGRGPERTQLLLTAGLLTVIILVLGQLTPRFFVEPYLLAAVAFGGGNGRSPSRLLLWLALGQGGFGAARALVIAGFAFPGALTPALRQDTLLRAAQGAAEARWLEQVTRPDDVVLTEIVGVAFLPRRFVSMDPLESDGFQPPTEAPRLQPLLSLQGGVTVVVLGPDQPVQAVMDLANRGTPLGPPEKFFYIQPQTTLPSFTAFLRSLSSPQAFVAFVRDPWSKPAPFWLQAFRLP